MSRNSIRNQKANRLGIGIFSAFFVTAATQAWVQIIDGRNILDKAQKASRFEVERTETARRGTIYSSDDKVLAQNNDVYELSINYTNVPKSDGFYLALSEATGIPAAELSMSAERGSRSKTWQQPLPRSKAEAVKTVKSKWFAHGVSLKRVPRRDYPFAGEFVALVGELYKEGGPTGLEKSLDLMLSGIDGKRKGLADRKGAFLPMRMTAEDQKALPGRDLTLTIDSSLQSAATSALKRAVEFHKANQGVAIIMDPATGDLLTAASWVRGQNDGEGNGFNPVSMARFEPGSTFKILTLAEALDLGVVNPDAFIQCNNSLVIGPKVIRCSHGAHGSIDARHAISKSCNISSAIWAKEIGYERFTKFFDSAGLMRKPGVGLPGEIPGFYVGDDPAKRIQLANFGFGQALSVTPISLCAAYNSLANNGLYHRPRLVKEVDGVEQALGHSHQLFSRETADTLLDFMTTTFEEDSGTAHNLRIPGYELAGKTGTAQKLSSGWSDKNKSYVANFVGYVPAKSPRATVLVMIDNPTGGQIYGGSVAGPIFKQIADSIIKRYNLPRTK